MPGGKQTHTSIRLFVGVLCYNKQRAPTPPSLARPMGQETDQRTICFDDVFVVVLYNVLCFVLGFVHRNGPKYESPHSFVEFVVEELI